MQNSIGKELKIIRIRNNLRLEEIAEVGFVDIDKALEILTYEQNKETLKQFIGSDKNEY